MAAPRFALRLDSEEKRDLQQQAAAAGVSLAAALKKGARLYLALAAAERALEKKGNA